LVPQTLQEVRELLDALDENGDNQVEVGEFIGQLRRVQNERRRRLRRGLGGAADAPTQVRSAYCNIIEAPWLVNGGHGASLKPSPGRAIPSAACPDARVRGAT
jgi:hypothetical protein